MKIKKHFELIIPTRDSGRWIGCFLERYRSLGIEPLYIYDIRSSDDTYAILTHMNARIAPYEPSGDFVEAGMIEFGANVAQSNWVLRFDDDEFPHGNLMRWINEVAIGSRSTSWWISRREVFAGNRGIGYSRAAGRYWNSDRPDALNPQERLFRPDCVSFGRQLHSSGLCDSLLQGFAPCEAFFAHFSCLLRTPRERYTKLQRYEAIRPGSCWHLIDEYLPELFPDAEHDVAYDGLDEFVSLIESFARIEDDVAFITARERLRLAELRVQHAAKLKAVHERAGRRPFRKMWRQARKTIAYTVGSALRSAVQSTQDANWSRRLM